MTNIRKYPENILVDTCFWIAYFDSNDANHKDAVKWSDVIFNYNVLCPFPTMYEFLNTRFCRNKKTINEFDRFIKKQALILIYDDNYRKNILEDFIVNNKYFPQYSLVDMLINRMIDDINLRINYLFTYNYKDFTTNCNKRNIVILPE